MLFVLRASCFLPRLFSDRTRRHSISVLLISIFCVMYFGVGEAYEKVYLNPQEALKVLFVDSDRVVSEKKQLSEVAEQELAEELGYALARSEYVFYLGKTGDKTSGYALIDHQIGKTRPISYIVLFSREGVIEQIEILAYRESHGSEVRHQRFLKQFRGQRVADADSLPVRISNISGATLSVRAITIGARRALKLWQHFYGDR